MCSRHYEVTIIVGLPGSGKTTFAHSMIDDDTFLIDDPNRTPSIWKDAKLSSKSKIIVCDPLLILSQRCTVIKFLHKKFGHDISLRWIYFSNNPDAAWKNHEHRNLNDPRSISKRFFDKLASKYVIPNNGNNVTFVETYQG